MNELKRRALALNVKFGTPLELATLIVARAAGLYIACKVQKDMEEWFRDNPTVLTEVKR